MLQPWVESAIFWIEGVATPGISIGGLLGEDDYYDEDDDDYDYDDDEDVDDDDDSLFR